ncbi:CDP-diacylglycerol--glycerol-3-phosphate 3-phosphatidyltransferase [Treponema denticola]|uniref:CDP-diacylglycerol--glycerol-3-phosphate 3-phosphatidyltransferase n=1 Tax=Treponema denticola TaxID=158 RepID=UPI0002B5013B|nr:CDP-diacylglycerol--glycerol-3-phosphate 3-phosphatidyltransferase [Treponema denticola]EMB26516.1 CDP-diacylglycerol-glycerol-3-phosphate 3-phosphatidyltransferase [Treponema denticola SP37]EPF33749.1 CDP-diacylglycerol-glycerol-3-phosphate 3-phosphatidyltransferase [Treponema denticola SP44]EPF39541.1 CDP-diacylglycerol-glycerol-3-phosphate 3-phosphatidyltransferase [Treponema denticola SP23]
MKLSNVFTSSRLVLAPIIYVLYFLPDWVPFINPKITILIIIPIFIFMEFTDFLDGYYARLHNQVDDFGKIFDPFADVVANITVLFCFLMDGFLFAPFFLIIVYREFGIMFLRMKARGEGITIGAKMGGKTKTVLYIVAASVSMFLKLEKIYAFLPPAITQYILYFNWLLYFAAVILSLVSFTDYITSYLNTRRTADE